MPGPEIHNKVTEMNGLTIQQLLFENVGGRRDGVLSEWRWRACEGESGRPGAWLTTLQIPISLDWKRLPPPGGKRQIDSVQSMNKL
eukprot:273216-Pelagomonas_calceolata.AAC.1